MERTYLQSLVWYTSVYLQVSWGTANSSQTLFRWAKIGMNLITSSLLDEACLREKESVIYFLTHYDKRRMSEQMWSLLMIQFCVGFSHSKIKQEAKLCLNDCCFLAVLQPFSEKICFCAVISFLLFLYCQHTMHCLSDEMLFQLFVFKIGCQDQNCSKGQVYNNFLPAFYTNMLLYMSML